MAKKGKKGSKSRARKSAARKSSARRSTKKSAKRAGKKIAMLKFSGRKFRCSGQRVKVAKKRTKVPRIFCKRHEEKK